MAKAIELLPCPFCGAEAQYRRFGAGNDWLTIECTNTYGACCCMSTTYTKESERILAEKWNRRSVKPITGELRKAIDEMFAEGEVEVELEEDEVDLSPSALLEGFTTRQLVEELFRRIGTEKEVIEDDNDF